MKFLILISSIAGLGLEEPQDQHLAEAPVCPYGGESCHTDDAPQVSESPQAIPHLKRFVGRWSNFTKTDLE
ncbi:hypothetical protein X797_010864 [Metarhizium robertsii]|uniref:Uncharacterized protein n=1 Tax=Metarhizium robertsii TaxID=568076 RepID=A0A014QT23_9HYPO|nr:hypothetical protein X797_010864 [Metarhizium robertsii]